MNAFFAVTQRLQSLHLHALIPNPLSLKQNKRVGVVPLCRPSDRQLQGQPRGDCPYQNGSSLVGFGITRSPRSFWLSRYTAPWTLGFWLTLTLILAWSNSGHG